jgi:hypothetical protein
VVVVVVVVAEEEVVVEVALPQGAAGAAECRRRTQ